MHTTEKEKGTTELSGVVFVHFETGMEGCDFAFNDSAHNHMGIHHDKAKREAGEKFEYWSYDGLYPLQRGDFLTVYDGDDIVFNGYIEATYDNLRVHKDPHRYHWLQKGIDGEQWCSMFHKEMKATLIPGPRHRKK